MLQIIIVIIIIIPIYKDGIAWGILVGMCKVFFFYCAATFSLRVSLWFREGCSVRLSLFWDFVYYNQLVSKELQRKREKEIECESTHTLRARPEAFCLVFGYGIFSYWVCVCVRISMCKCMCVYVSGHRFLSHRRECFCCICFVFEVFEVI